MTPRLAPERMSYSQLLVAAAAGGGGGGNGGGGGAPLLSARDDQQRQRRERREDERRRERSGSRRRGTRRDRYLRESNKGANLRGAVRELSEGLVTGRQQQRPRTSGAAEGGAGRPRPQPQPQPPKQKSSNGMAVNAEKLAYYRGTIKIGLDEVPSFHKWNSTQNGVVLRPSRDAFVPREAAAAAVRRGAVDARQQRREGREQQRRERQQQQQQQQRGRPQTAGSSSGGGGGGGSAVVCADTLVRQLLLAGEPSTKKMHMDGILTKLPISAADAAAAKVSEARAKHGAWDGAMAGICRERAQDKEWNAHRNQFTDFVEACLRNPQFKKRGV